LCIVQLCKTNEELRSAQREVVRLRTALERNEKQSVDWNIIVLYNNVFVFRQRQFSIYYLVDHIV